MFQPKPDLRAIKAAAKSQFGHIPGVEGFGIGDGTLRIYVRSEDIRRQLPNEYQGVPVEFVITGDIVAYTS